MEEFYLSEKLSTDISLTDETSFQKYKRVLKEKLTKFYVDHIPIESIQEMSPVYVYTYGTVAYLLSLFFFLGFLIQNYYSNINAAYMSLDSSGNCKTIPIAVSNSYLADTRGNWIGTPQFSYYHAKYVLNLNGFNITTYQQYIDMMHTFENSLRNIGKKAVHQNLAYNLIYWMGFVEYYSVTFPSSSNFTTIGKGQLQSLQMTGYPKQVFDLNYQVVRVTSYKGYCPLIPDVSYNKATGIISATFVAPEFMNTTACLTAFHPGTVGWVPEFTGKFFELNVNVESLAIAMAVNLGILSVDDLELAQVYDLVLTYDITDFGNISLVANSYFDTRYKTMSPILCLTNITAVPPDTVQTLCFLPISYNAIALPVFNPGENPFTPFPTPCNCSNNYDGCNMFNLLAGFIVYDINIFASIEALRLSVLLLANAVMNFPSYAAFNEAAFYISSATAKVAIGVADEYLYTQQFLEESFQFCYLPDYDAVCSIVVFQSLDLNHRQVSAFHYALIEGSCSDSFSVPHDIWENLVQEPPTKFYENYYTCYPNSLTTLQTAAGVAQGNTAIVLPFVVFLLLPLVYFILFQLQQIPPPEEYTAEEKAAAADVLQTIMLRLRDGKRKSVEKDGVLDKFYEEVRDAAYASFQDDGDETGSNHDHRNDNPNNKEGGCFRLNCFKKGEKVDRHHVIEMNFPATQEHYDMA